MIYYNSNTINDWNYGSDNIVKVYRNNAVCYYKITGGGDTPTAQTPCFAVVDDISQYSSTEFVDVYDKATEKWYKLNNLNQYEEYGIYGSGRNITYYEGKLTIDDGYEYQYSGGSWNNVGEVSGGTATLPNVPFTVNYNAKNYDANTKTLAKTSGQLADVDAVITAGTPTVNDGYLTIASGTRATISGYQTYFNRTNSAPNLTIISKQRTDGSNCHMFANRDSNYNWMYRAYDAYLTLHGSSAVRGVSVTTQPVIESVRVNSNRLLTFNNYTDNTSKTSASFKYGSTNSGKFAMFQGYATTTGENFVGDFYWVYMSQNTLTDEQVQQVIAYNEGGGGQPEYPMYYDEMQDPPDNLTFSTMTEAEAYECPWYGMSATIGAEDYMFCEGNEWLTKYSYVEVSGEYVCDNGDKYKKMQEYDRQADGTFSPSSNYVKGDLIESGSPDCSTDYSTQYLTLVAQTDSVSFKYDTATSSNKLQYSLDSGSTWNNLSNNQSTTSVNTGDKVLFKASGLTVNTERGVGRITPSASASVEGNIMSLEYGDNFSGQTTIQNNYQFRKLFSGVTTITSAENMVLPATTLKTQCYSQMFQGCTSLTATPITVGSSTMTWSGSYCMSNMFSNCTSLVNVSSTLLPALNLGTQCYWYMFENSTSLIESPLLLATTLEGQSYQGMFNGCSSLNTITCLATNQSNRTNDWTTGVAATGTFYKHPSASWSSGNNGIPSTWTVVDYTS